MHSIINNALRLLSPVFRAIPISWIEFVIWSILSAKIKNEQPEQSLKLLLRLDNRLYGATGSEAIRYGKGTHVKRRFTRYIDHFALKATQLDGPFLDVGCSTGEMASSIAKTTSCEVTGIDFNEESVKKAKLRHRHHNLNFLVGDITTAKLAGSFKTVILSNVLEHITNREHFIAQLIKTYNVDHFLIRVPNFERDWRVPLKQELGVEYFLDSTHEVEHKPLELQKEIESAGLTIQEIEYKWGEIWVVAQTNRSR